MKLLNRISMASSFFLLWVCLPFPAPTPSFALDPTTGCTTPDCSEYDYTTLGLTTISGLGSLGTVTGGTPYTTAGGYFSAPGSAFPEAYGTQAFGAVGQAFTVGPGLYNVGTSVWSASQDPSLSYWQQVGAGAAPLADTLMQLGVPAVAGAATLLGGGTPLVAAGVGYGAGQIYNFFLSPYGPQLGAGMSDVLFPQALPTTATLPLGTGYSPQPVGGSLTGILTGGLPLASGSTTAVTTSPSQGWSTPSIPEVSPALPSTGGGAIPYPSEAQFAHAAQDNDITVDQAKAIWAGLSLEDKQRYISMY